MNSLVRRTIGAMAFRAGIYREIAAQPTATTQAIGILLLTCLVPGSVSIVYGRLGGILYSVSGWLIWFCLAYLIGVKIFPESPAEFGILRLLRTTGFASAPALLGFLGLVVTVGHILPVAITMWMIATTAVAIREAFQYRTMSRAVAVCLASWAATALILALLFR
jgi:hypothetical protein